MRCVTYIIIIIIVIIIIIIIYADDRVQYLDKIKVILHVLQGRISGFGKVVRKGVLGTEVPQWGPGAKPRLAP